MNKLESNSAPDVRIIAETASKFSDNTGNIIVGKKEAIELVFVALLCEGHILIEDVPGIGKTLLAKTTARSLDCSFKRIQCTPDLLPSDVTGIHFFNQRTGEFELRPGPIVANVVLADEINRATPRTQSCLLESMQEQQVTVDLETIPLPRPFMVIATQNPIELEGTFPLPEAQLDRFLLKIQLGYPTQDEEEAILYRFQQANPLDILKSVLHVNELLQLQKLCRQVYTENSVRTYITEIARSTRGHKDIKLGASPRATLGLHLAAQGLAAIRGRGYVLPDDVKYLAPAVLAHRITPKREVILRGHSSEDIIREIIAGIPVPVESS
ncbi:AAA family ATPase [Chloroflexota bacterium]